MSGCRMLHSRLAWNFGGHIRPRRVPPLYNTYKYGHPTLSYHNDTAISHSDDVNVNLARRVLCTLDVLTADLSVMNLQSVDSCYHKHVYSYREAQSASKLTHPFLQSGLLRSTSQVNLGTQVNLATHRLLHSTPYCYKEDNTVEKTVKVVKEMKASSPEPATVVAEPKKSLWQKIVAELKHYYHGFRLFLIEVKISLRLVRSLLDGNTLSRRERRQLVRTSSDVFRLVPFLVFIIVPFMEFLLPVALKLFPNMLPSTFREENKEIEGQRKRLKVKMEMAKFLQETIHDTVLDWKNRSQSKSLATDFGKFVEKVRKSGELASRDEILKYSKLFEDEITMDSFSRMQLVALCRLFNLSTIGTDNFLRFQLRMKLRDLKSDDKMIMMEGINTLTAKELQVACRERGMRALGLSEDRLKAQLQQWLDLHLKDEIPTTLLLLSRAMYLPEEASVEDQLKVTISALSQETAEKAKIKIAEVSGEKVDNRTKINLIRDEEAAIKKEKADKKLEEEKAAKLRDLAASELLDRELLKEVPGFEANISTSGQVHRPLGLGEPDVEDEISSKDLEDIESAIENLASEKQFDIAKDELKNLKEDVEEYASDLQGLKEVIVATGGKQEDIVQTKAAQRMSKMLNKMIGQMDTIISGLHVEKASLMEDLEMKEIKVKRNLQLQEDEQARKEILDDIKQTKYSVISTNDLILAMKRLQKIPNEDRLKKIAEVLDEDKDGRIEVEHILMVVEQLGQENVKLSPTQVSEVIRVLKEEVSVDSEAKLKKKEEEQFKKLLEQESLQREKDLKKAEEELLRDEVKK